MIREAGWSASPEKYSDGDGSTNFRLPRMSSAVAGNILAVKAA